MSYQRQLAFHLRGRGYREGEIAEIIHDVEAHGTSEADLVREFGQPGDYADRFEKKKGRRSRGARLLIIAGVLGVGWFAFVVFAGIVFRFDVRDIVGPVVLWPALALIAVGVLAGFLSDHLRPAPTWRRDGSHERRA